jgi:polyisoprenoid-binding protein YceI
MKSLRTPKCKCGKTNDKNGNCDGSHANLRDKLSKVVLGLVLFLTAFVFQSFTTGDNVKVKSSSIEWKGEKVVGSHEGTIALKSAELIYKGKKLKGGNFVIDMTSITCTDLSGEYKGKLEGHLKSDDFFGVAKHPTSTLNITKVTSKSANNYSIDATLTIKGITKAINFDATTKGKKLSATINVDRTKYVIKYGSGSFFDSLGDNMIYDDFEIQVNLEI